MPRFPHKTFEVTTMDAVVFAVLAAYCLVVGILALKHHGYAAVATLVTAYIGFFLSWRMWQLAKRQRRQASMSETPTSPANRAA